MAQTSITLAGLTDHKANVTGTDISFNEVSGVNKITSTTTSLNNFSVRDLITITGTTNNNSIFTVKSIVSANEITVEETVTDEAADGSTIFTLDHTGFVTDKQKGDGYYSQGDGLHTVVFNLTNRGDSTDDFNGSVRMQGSLATTPTENDWFDIAGTTHTSDLSTTTVSSNFTGNFVWVRAKVITTNGTSNRAMITSILYNN